MPGTVAGTSYTPLVLDSKAAVEFVAAPTAEKALEHVPQRGQVESGHYVHHCGGKDVRVNEEAQAVMHPLEIVSSEFRHLLQLDCACVVGQLQPLLQ